MALSRVTLPLFGSNYNRSDFVNLSQRRLLNMYLEPAPDGQSYAAVSTPGYTSWANVGGAKNRQAINHKEILYVVVDNVFAKINASGVITNLGTLNTVTGDVTMAAISSQVGIADGTNVYNYNVDTDTFSVVTDPNLPANCLYIAAANDYFFYAKPNSSTIYVSNLSDGTTVNALAFFTCNASFDNVLAIGSCQNKAYFFGTSTTEIWYPNGDATIYFGRQNVVDLGIYAPYSCKTIGSALYWLARDKNGLVGIATGADASISLVTNTDFVSKVNSYPTAAISAAYGWVQIHNGHVFYNITFPSVGVTLGHTWAYDVTTGSFFERTSWNPNGLLGPSYDRYTASWAEYLNGLELIGDFQSGNIYKVDSAYYDDNGYNIEREVVGLHLTYKDEFFSASNLQINFEGGLGTDTVLDPKAMIYISKDWGHTYTRPIIRSIGAAGTFKKRVRIGAVGGAYVLTFKIRMTDAVPYKLTGSSVDLQVRTVDN